MCWLDGWEAAVERPSGSIWKVDRSWISLPGMFSRLSSINASFLLCVFGRCVMLPCLEEFYSLFLARNVVRGNMSLVWVKQNSLIENKYRNGHL